MKKSVRTSRLQTVYCSAQAKPGLNQWLHVTMMTIREIDAEFWINSQTAVGVQTLNSRQR